MYYPDQHNVSKATNIRRECFLPEGAIGKVQVTVGMAVDARDIVAHGAIPARHIILEGAAFFGLRDPSALKDWMLVEVGKAVTEKQPIAGRSATRGKRLLSPINGILTRVADGRIIIQEMPQLLDLQAGIKGTITQVIPGRGVIIETVGAQVEGMWGNGGSVIATLRMEPDAGIETLMSDQLNLTYKGAVIVTRRPLREIGLEIAESQNVAGIIAPSMSADLRERLLRSDLTVMLTEGFGAMTMSNAVYNLLSEVEGRQVTLDAYTPSKWDSGRPSVIINIPLDEKPAGSNFLLALRKGMRVRINREPYLGQIGRVIDLPKKPILLENGLRVLGARIETITGQIVDVPLSNLEVAGR